MKTTISLLIILLLLSASVKAQSDCSFKLDMGADVMVPASSFHDYFYPGIGSTVRAGYNITNFLQLNVTTGYLEFFSKGDNAFDFPLPNAGYIPLRAGASIFPVNAFYIDGSAGFGFYQGKGGNSTEHAFSLGAGYIFNNVIDASIRFEGNTSKHTPDMLSFIGIRVAYLVIK